MFRATSSAYLEDSSGILQFKCSATLAFELRQKCLRKWGLRRDGCFGGLLRRQNHWFDALYNACAAGHYCGVRLVSEKRQPKRYYTLQELQQNALNRPSARELAAQSQR